MRTAIVATLFFVGLVWLDATLAALQTAGDDTHISKASTESQIGLCQATPTQRREYSIARFEDESPSPGIESFLAEWHRDLSPGETRRYEPLRPVS